MMPEIVSKDRLIYYRLVAIWILCEAMLGGIIHGFKIPVSGLVVGSSAVVCICLIAWYVPVKGAILKATIIVAIFKMMLSPQAPPPAYIAVFFQGLLGELLFWKRRFFSLTCIIFAVLALLESGLQRILVLTIIYGNDLWVVINNFINGLTKQKVATNYSLWIGIGYVFIHFIVGVLVGWWASIIPSHVRTWQADERFILPKEAGTVESVPIRKKKRKRVRAILLVIWILLLGLYVQSYFGLGKPLLPTHISMKILLRSLIIVLAWVFIIGPLLKTLLHRWLQKKQDQSREDIGKILELLPATQQLIINSWKASGDYRGLKRIKQTGRLILANALLDVESSKVFILTGPIQTGKTTSLVEWSSNREDVFGILTPVINGERVFMNASTREQFPMEAKGAEPVYEVGRFRFSKEGFERARSIIRGSINKKGWLVIDEIGPLELRGEGFSDVLNEVLATHKGNILVVVRDKDHVLEGVRQAFNMDRATLVKEIHHLDRASIKV